MPFNPDSRDPDEVAEEKDREQLRASMRRQEADDRVRWLRSQAAGETAAEKCARERREYIEARNLWLLRLGMPMRVLKKPRKSKAPESEEMVFERAPERSSPPGGARDQGAPAPLP